MKLPSVKLKLFKANPDQVFDGKKLQLSLKLFDAKPRSSVKSHTILALQMDK